MQSGERFLWEVLLDDPKSFLKDLNASITIRNTRLRLEIWNWIWIWTLIRKLGGGLFLTTMRLLITSLLMYVLTSDHLSVFPINLANEPKICADYVTRKYAHLAAKPYCPNGWPHGSSHYLAEPNNGIRSCFCGKNSYSFQWNEPPKNPGDNL